MSAVFVSYISYRNYSAAFSSVASAAGASATGAAVSAAVDFLRERLVFVVFLAVVSFNMFSL